MEKSSKIQLQQSNYKVTVVIAAYNCENDFKLYRIPSEADL